MLFILIIDMVLPRLQILKFNRFWLKTLNVAIINGDDTIIHLREITVSN